MKTDELIAMLASGPDVAVAAPPWRRTLWPLLAGLAASMAIMLAMLGLRPDLAQAERQQAFWLKLLFSVALAAVSWLAARRLAAPGARINTLPLWIGTPLLLLWCVAAATLLGAAPESRASLFWGSTWRVCPTLIALISLPMFAAALHLMRGLAPTRLRLAGAAAGLAAGAAAAALYCLHCPEMSAVFVGFWYVAGMLIPTALGALIGPRVLAW
ncbi:NrsF family protein [Massilia sp. PWRC2]|uniref:NrsF family protein n=1 Tax=Massilia sp. PWRC2 TaxID=2804626 RepID=UPI003CE7D7F3